MSFWRIAVIGVLVFAVTDGFGKRLRMVDLDEGAAGHAVSLQVGDEVRVTLGEAGGTGYRWHLAHGCEGMLHAVGEEREAGTQARGASGRRRWVFAAQGVGTCELRFDSVRLWEKGVSGRVVVFPIKVSGR